MRKFNSFILATVFAGSIFYSCDNAEIAPSEEPISETTLSQIKSLGFSTEGAIRFEQGYLVENDIYLTDASIASMSEPNFIPTVEQYSTNELVCGSRVITVYAPVGGRSGYSAGMIAGLDLAIARYNAENLTISFQRVSSSNNADIVMTRLSKRDERQGVLGSAGFPSSCNPYGQIKMSGVLESSYGLSTGGIATIIAHEMGHCIGFRHTDFFDRSISCGGGPANEGASTVGANHIPGTPTGASAAAKSWMLACTDGGDRPFNNDDKTALNYLY
ncbi:M57 family metalloprotease [Fulvivirga lutea]|uniref:Protease B n=1 Tax=Fulvivirga lutea TaxID=2810512 RepID=A0A975A1Y2_9BACT|nr:M57 family metalloprotease [Fulvivirga lutea]QSE98841.1 protease B [Fulvivirga lutea]